MFWGFFSQISTLTIQYCHQKAANLFSYVKDVNKSLISKSVLSKSLISLFYIMPMASHTPFFNVEQKACLKTLQDFKKAFRHNIVNLCFSVNDSSFAKTRYKYVFKFCQCICFKSKETL